MTAQMRGTEVSQASALARGRLQQVNWPWFICSLLAASLIASGVVMIVVSFSSKVQQGRWWILLSGFITAITGLILAAGWPLSGVWALGMIMAIDLTFQGWALIAFGLALKGAK